MATVTVTGYKEANQALALADLKQSLYDEGKVLMDRVLVALHGEDHRQRRLLEMRIFKKDFFHYYEKQVLPAVVDRTLARFLPTGRADLMDFGRRAMLDLTADFAGIDRQSNSDEERDALVAIIHGLGAAATLGQFHGDREPVREAVRRTLHEFDQRFFTPSVARRQALIARHAAGEIPEDALPRDILTILLRNEDRVDLPRDMILRETAFYYLAGAHTSVHSLTHAMNEMFRWAEKHPEDADRLRRDPLFVQRCVHESLRLHPSSPIAKRKPTCPGPPALGRGRWHRRHRRHRSVQREPPDGGVRRRCGGVQSVPRAAGDPAPLRRHVRRRHPHLPRPQPRRRRRRETGH